MQPESKDFSLNFRPFVQKASRCVLTTRETGSLLITAKEGRGSFLLNLSSLSHSGEGYISKNISTAQLCLDEKKDKRKKGMGAPEVG